MAGFLFTVHLYLQDVRGLTAMQAGLTILPMPVVMALCARWPGGWWPNAARGFPWSSRVPR